MGMVTTLRRIFWLAVLGGAGYAGWTAWQRREGDEAAPAPEWPPLDPPAATPASEPVGATMPSAGMPPAATAAGLADQPAVDRPTGDAAHTATWVAPVEGACPDGYPIKANDNSGIFHVPGGRFYDRTVPERCYADAADAEADGYRRAKA
jgi:hypothetical protein